MNPQTVSTHSEVEKTTGKTFNKFNYEAFYHDYVNFYDLHKSLYGPKKSLSVMQSEKVTLCEINASLWVKAVCSATNSLTKHTYTHYIIVQKLINYLLNTDSNENFGLIENYFWKLLLTHPPSPEMFDYYWQIICENFVYLNGKETENQSLFFCLVETITNCLKVNINSEGNVDLNKSARSHELSAENESNLIGLDSQSRFMEVRKSPSFFSNKPEAKINQNEICFYKLPPKEKMKRSLIVLNFIYNILETDFIFWLHSNEFKLRPDNNKPLISYLLWKKQKDFGSVNKEIQKLLQLYKLAMNLDVHNIRVVEKFLTLIGEVIRWSDSTGGTKYPFVGKNSFIFSRELSLILHQRLIEVKNNLAENELIVNFKLPWLRLFLCSHLLTSITRHQCFPELRGVYEILEYIIHNEANDSNNEKAPVKSSDATNLLLRKREKFKNINAKLRNGKTHLHSACENNDVEKIKSLLTFPELDVNAVDRKGRTALHIAAYKGKTTSVQELLSFFPKPGGPQKSANIRARGPESTTPLMCAASQGHAKICKLLLEHSGPILLEDVNEFNQTALELSNASGVRRILKYYKSKSGCSKNSFININFDSNFKKLVMKLCLEMTQAYFSTYKTWDIYKTLKQSEKTIEENQTAFEVGFKSDCLCYYKDTKKDINKLKSLLPKLDSIEEFKSLSDIYKTIFSLN